MTVETETALIKLLEKIEQKLDKFIKTTQKDLTELKVGQATLGGKVETTDVKIENLQKGQNELESELKDLKTEQKETRNEVSGLYKWVIVLIVTSVLSLGNIFLRIFDFFSKTT